MTRRLRLLSVNLKNGAADPDLFGALVEAMDPDVVAVQEIAPEQADVLARLLPFGKLEPTRNHKGMGVALREPGSVRYVPLRYRGLYVAEVSAPGAEGPVEIVNAHIAAPHTLPLGWAFARRRAQLRGLLAYLDTTPCSRRVIVGDLNSTPLWPLYRRLAATFTDAALETAARTGRPPERTWGPRPGGRRLLRIDHALVSGLMVDELRVMPVRGSDHWALLVDLTVPAAP